MVNNKELTKEQRRKLVYYYEDSPYSVSDVMEMADEGETCDEMCPECGREVSIPVTGGYCVHCGHWCLPCSMCDQDVVDCDWGGDRCPFVPLRPDRPVKPREEDSMKVLIRRVQMFEKEVEIPNDALIDGSVTEWLADHEQQTEMDWEDCIMELGEEDLQPEVPAPGVHIPRQGEGDGCR